MLVEVTGVIEVGGARGRNIPQDARRDLLVPQGETVTVRFRVYRSDGTAFDMTGSTLKMTARKSARQALLFLKEASRPPASSPNVVDVILLPSDTRLIQPGLYVWDAWITANSGEQLAAVPVSHFALEPTARGST